MAESNGNAIFKEIADRYIAHYGDSLLDEAEQLGRQPRVTPRMDNIVRRQLKSGGTRRYAAGIVALAAVFALVVMLPMLLSQDNPDIVGDGQSTAAAPSGQSSAPELIPISFTLPDNLTVTDSKLDHGKSVYYLTDSRLDDVVMTMEYDPAEDVFAGLKQTRINDSTVYYKYSADYSVMAFQKYDITYVLTCKYDVNTLVPLAEAIL